MTDTSYKMTRSCVDQVLTRYGFYSVSSAQAFVVRHGHGYTNVSVLEVPLVYLTVLVAEAGHDTD